MAHIKYAEGQWFAVPLRKGGYALGVIVRGNNRTKGGLGYFFGPRCPNLPTPMDTYQKDKDNAVFVGQFGDLGIIRGEWPLINQGKPFVREEWPVPIFCRILPFPKDKAVLVEYDQAYSGNERPIRETVVPLSPEILALPRDGLSGSGAVVSILDNRLEVI